MRAIRRRQHIRRAADFYYRRAGGVARALFFLLENLSRSSPIRTTHWDVDASQEKRGSVLSPSRVLGVATSSVCYRCSEDPVGEKKKKRKLVFEEFFSGSPYRVELILYMLLCGLEAI